MKQEKTVGLAVGIPIAVVGLGVVAGSVYAMTEMDRFDPNQSLALYASVGGGLLTAVGYVVCTVPRTKQAWPKRYYSEEQATEMVDIYNAEKLKELGITKDDVLEYLKERTQAPTFTVTPYVAANGFGLTGTF